MTDEPPGPLSSESRARIMSLYDQLAAEQRGPTPACRCGRDLDDGQALDTCPHDSGR